MGGEPSHLPASLKAVTDTDRARVGRALDLIRDVLAPYVDAAMTTAHGAKWDERIASEDARRRASGRKYPVSKTDLSVLLKVIQHERIAPWAGTQSDPAGRIRSFASELLTLRNLYAHGDECLGEHDRLLDTAGRLLRMLGLPMPDGLDPEQPSSTADSQTAAIAELSQFSIYDQQLLNEVERLGPAGWRLQEIGARAFEISEIKVGRLAVANGDYDQMKQALINFVDEFGPESLDLIDETESIMSRLDDTAIALRAFALHTLDSVLWSMPDTAAIYLGRNQSRFQEEAFLDRLRWLTKHRESVVERSREIARLARQLNDGEVLPNIMIGSANFMLEIDSDPEEVLRLRRDTVERIRLLAAIDPGSDREGMLVRALRREGEQCNDMGRTDEAVRAFARADEIVDRYPTADPGLEG